MVGKLRKKEVYLLLGSVIFCLILSEGTLQFFGLYPPPFPQCGYWDPKICGLYQEYPPHGYRLVPSKKTQYSYPRHNPRQLSLTSNSHGFRDRRELNKSDNRVRIMVLGDSMVLGQGVEEDERFTNILENMEPSWRIDNLGMTGFGPDLMLRALQEVGLQFNPDVVVFSMYTDDFRRVHPYYSGMGYRSPRFTLRSGKLVFIPYPTLNTLERTHLFQVLHKIYWKLFNKEYKLTEAILIRFIELSHLYHFVPVIIFIPGSSEHVNDKERRQWLGSFAKDQDISYLDLSVAIHRVNRNEAYIPKNAHFNVQGHEIVAREIHRFLKEQSTTSKALGRVWGAIQ